MKSTFVVRYSKASGAYKPVRMGSGTAKLIGLRSGSKGNAQTRARRLNRLKK